MSEISVQHAAEMSGKSRDTINQATNNGTLSFTKNARGHKRIAIAELERVYGPLKKIDETDPTKPDVGKRPAVSDPDVREELIRIRERLEHREEINETLRLERERERRQLLDEIESLRASLEKAQEQQSKALLLITDQSRGPGDKLDEISRQLTTHKEQIEKQLGELREENRARDEKQGRDLPWWEHVFGSKRSA